ncbi:MAG: Eco57I restriction-modification methylase domain-containing protein, partial [Thermoplasmata archaeon]
EVLGLKVVSPEEIIGQFGASSSLCRSAVKMLHALYLDYVDRIEFIAECFDLWRSVYGCAANLNEAAVRAVKQYAIKSFDLTLRTREEVEVFLFTIQTYFAVLMKLLVARVVIQHRIIEVPTVEILLRPDPMESYPRLDTRIPYLKGVFEYDSFSWFIDITKISREPAGFLNTFLLDIARRLDILDFGEVSTDLMKRIYQQFFDPSTRVALGEFYTDDAIVEEVLEAAGWSEEEKGKLLLDPACGSGSFLVRAMRTIINSEGSKVEKLDLITKTIAGVDIHPFAVAMAKVNYILALSPLLDPQTMGMVHSVRIPIYWADSLTMLAEARTLAGVRTYKARIPILGEFELPNPKRIPWDELFEKASKALRQGWTEEAFIEDFGDNAIVYRESLARFLETFRERENKGLNGRWLITLENLLFVDELRGKCDYIVGNPPWVRVHNVAREIRDMLKESFMFYGKGVGWNPGFEKTRIPFAKQVDYSMAFVEAGLRYLKDGGTLAFVITSKIQQALYANLLRKKLLTETQILRLVDYSLSPRQLFEGATNYPLIFSLSKTSPPKGHEIELVVHNSRGGEARWKIRQSELPIIRNDPESPWAIAPSDVTLVFRKMQANGIRLGDLLEVNRGVMTSANDLFLVKEFTPTTTETIVAATTEGGEIIRLEKELLAPIIRGRDVSSWKAEPSGFVIWTHDSDGGVLSSLPSNAQSYFQRHEQRLKRRSDYRKGQPPWVIFRVSSSKLKEKVAWHELAKRLESSYLPRVWKSDYLGTCPLIPIQTVYFVSPEKESLGHVLVSLFNSFFVRSFIASIAERARGGYFRHIAWTMGLIPIPKKIIENLSERDISTVRKLERISRRLHLSPDEMPAPQNDVKALIADLYGFSEAESFALEEYYRFMTIVDSG